MWNFTTDRPVYLQIVDEIIARIAGGVYKPGERIPSVRELAEEAAYLVCVISCEVFVSGTSETVSSEILSQNVFLLFSVVIQKRMYTLPL